MLDLTMLVDLTCPEATRDDGHGHHLLLLFPLYGRRLIRNSIRPDCFVCWRLSIHGHEQGHIVLIRLRVLSRHQA